MALLHLAFRKYLRRNRKITSNNLDLGNFRPKGLSTLAMVSDARRDKRINKTLRRLSVLVLAGFISSAAMGHGGIYRIFDTTGHPKAKGVRLTIAYPEGLKAQEGQRPRVVQNFFGSTEGVDLVMSLAAERHTEGDFEKDCAAATRDEWIELFQSLGLGVPNSVQLMQWKRRPAAISSFQTSSMLEKQIIHSNMKMLFVCHQKWSVTLTCGTSAGTKTELNSTMPKVEAVCSRFRHSLNFKD